MSKLCNFGKEIKKRLVDIDKNQEWLITEVRADTGLYFDTGYLHKILVGSISKILEIPIPTLSDK